MLFGVVLPDPVHFKLARPDLDLTKNSTLMMDCKEKVEGRKPLSSSPPTRTIYEPGTFKGRLGKSLNEDSETPERYDFIQNLKFDPNPADRIYV